MVARPRRLAAAIWRTFQICAGDVLARKYAALVAHRSQTAPLIDQIEPERYRQWWATEAFVAAAVDLEDVA
jgi:hypothetical protein